MPKIRDLDAHEKAGALHREIALLRWTDNINNVLPEHMGDMGECIAFARRAELLLRKPIQILLDTANPAIANVGPSLMTTEARLVALFDLLERGAINEATLVSSLSFRHRIPG